MFNGCIASEMTLGGAIVQGILPAPKYVTDDGIHLGRWVYEQKHPYFGKIKKDLKLSSIRKTADAGTWITVKQKERRVT